MYKKINSQQRKKIKKSLAALIVLSPLFLPMVQSGSAAAASLSWTKLPTSGAGFSSPAGIAVDSSGNLYVANWNNARTNAVDKLIQNSTSWSDISGSSPPFTSPTGIAVDGSGDIFVSDSTANQIYELISGSSSWTPIQNGSQSAIPYAIATNSLGDVFVTNYFNSVNGVNSSVAPVEEGTVSASGTWTWTGLPTTGGSFSGPYGIAVDSSGNVYVADAGANKIEELKNSGTSSSPTYTSWTIIGQNGVNGGNFSSPYGIAVDSSGNVFVTNWILGSGAPAVEELTNGNWVDITNNGGFNQPGSIAVNSSGNVFVADAKNNDVEELTLTGTQTATVNAATPTITSQPQSVTVNVYGSAPLSVTANTSDSGTLSYQWYSNTADSNSGGTPLSVTSATYNAPTSQSGTMYYYVTVTNTNNSVNGTKTASITSNAATVTVNALTNAATPTITSQPQGSTVDVGGSAPLSVTANTSDSGTLSYQWYSNTTDSNSGGTAITGATSAAYSAPSSNSGTEYYYVVVTNTNDNVNGTKTASITSNAAMITVNAVISHSGGGNHHSGGSSSSSSSLTTSTSTSSPSSTTTGTASNTKTNTSSTTLTGKTTTTTGESSPANFLLPVIKSQQKVGTTAATVQKTFGNTDVKVNIPNQALSSQGAITITTGTLDTVKSHEFTGMTTKNTPLLVGVYFTGTTTKKPVTVTVTKPNIPPYAKVFDLIPGVGYVQVPAQVSKGKIVTTVTGNTSMAIVNITPHQRAITLGTHLSVVPVITKPVAKSQVTYLPVFYVMQEFKTVGIQSTWNGYQWNLAMTNQPKTKAVKTGSRSMEITFDGSKVLQNVTKVVAVDPYSGKNITYMSLPSMNGLLHQLGFKTQWNGTVWSLAKSTTPKNMTDLTSN